VQTIDTDGECMNDPKDNDYKLLMLYLEEHDDPTLQQQVSDSEELSTQFKQLQDDMYKLETQMQQHQPDEKYGVHVWEQIADKLETPQQASATEKQSWLSHWLSGLPQLRFSFATVAGLMLVVTFSFFMLNRTIQQPAEAHLDQRLLAQSIHRHLTQTEIFLTRLSNSTDGYQPDFHQTAQQLLSSNRLFKAAVAEQNSPHLSLLLSDLERVFLELANQPENSPRFLNSNQQRVAEQNLLFKVKTMAHQLDYESIKL